ncbi:glycosyltransferase family 39 protein [Fontivita pretiosa]|uniref:glycosyltransferase family 39 protein n=1 Tax=Fontivita pretiosa TaxID=2989684 RepID=UPI003D18418C
MIRVGGRHLPALLSAVVGIALFAICIGGTYVYDDHGIIQNDPRLRDPARWHLYWTESYNGGVDNLYRPLVSMTYAIQWWLHGDRPWAFHLVNVLLHGAVSACAAELARRLAGQRAAWVAGLLFAAHPIHVEAVANIVGRAELMCALGTLGALVLMLKPLTPGRAVAITACFVLALLSKEQGMLVPALLLTLALSRRLLLIRQDADSTTAQPPIDPARLRQGRLLLTLLLCWGLAGYVVWRESILKFWWDRNFLDWTINPMVPSEWHPYGGSVGRDRWLMPLALLGRYAALLVLPIKLSPDYGAKVIGWSVSWGDPYLWIGATAVVAWCAVMLVALLKRSAAGVFAALALALSYGLVGNIVALIGVNFAERLMYLPSAFFLLLVAMAMTRLSRPILVAFTTIALVPGSIRTVTYAARWNDRLEFYRKSLEEQPQSIRLVMLLAAEYAARGQLDEAEQVVRRGTEMLPEYWDIWKQCGVIAMMRRDWEEAGRCFDKAANIRPSAGILAAKAELEAQRLAAQQRAATAPATTSTTR